MRSISSSVVSADPSRLPHGGELLIIQIVIPYHFAAARTTNLGTFKIINGRACLFLWLKFTSSHTEVLSREHQLSAPPPSSGRNNAALCHWWNKGHLDTLQVVRRCLFSTLDRENILSSREEMSQRSVTHTRSSL